MGFQTHKKILRLAVAIVGALVFMPQIVWSQPANRDRPVELIVSPKETAASLQQSLRSGVVPKTQSDSLFNRVESIAPVFNSDRRSKNGGRDLSVFRLSVPDSASFRRLRGRWQQHPDVRYAHANVTFSVNAASIPNSGRDDPVLRPNNVLADSLDHLDVIQALDAWSVTTGSTDVQIGVVDTGVFLEHPDLTGQFWINEAEDANGNGRFDPYPATQGGDLNGEDDDGNGFVDDVIGYDFVDRPSAIPAGEFEGRDPDPSPDTLGGFSWHGTAVSGVAAAAPGDPEEGIAGVAPDTRLVALRAFGRDGRGQSDDIAAAIVYGASNDLDVLNLSFGRDRAVPLIEDVIEYANDQGTIVVGSAGNSLTDDPHYPSDYPDVLSVVWLGENGQLPRFNSSQFGIGVDLGAPGSAVYTADFPADKIREGAPLEREDLYRSPDGSSFSAPQVAGAAALLRSADSSLSPASIRSILTATSEDIEGANWDHTTGSGLLNVEQALTRAYPARTEITRPEHNQGVRGDSPVAITGTAIDPAFNQYAVFYAEGTDNLDQRADPWTQLQSPTSRQVFRDTLAVWSPEGLTEGEYTLRLVTTLHDGRTIEDRRRVRIDRSPPEVSLPFLGQGRVEGENGIVADVKTDDVTQLRMQVQLGRQSKTVRSEYQARRQGMAWANEHGISGQATVQIHATNATGLTTTVDTTLQVPASQENTGLLRRTTTDLPGGRVLPEPVDFDGDGLKEVLMNQFVNGGVSDTLRSFEWDGSTLVPADTLVVGPFFPKDVGDTNGDGLQELLLQVNRATVLLEQPSPDAFPTDLIYADTSRISDAPGDTLDGARLTDLDADGQGEVVGSDQRQWKVIERKASGFEEIDRLSNPTRIGPDSAIGNVFDFQEAATGDFDNDGQQDLLVGDRDGDLIVYEAAGDDHIEVAWTQENDRLYAGTRFATGDFTGTGRTDFVTLTTSQLTAAPDAERTPPISYYTVWRNEGDDDYGRAYRLPLYGSFTLKGGLAPGSLGAADVDNDGRDEVVVAHPPSLMVLDRAADGTWRVRYEDRPSPILSRSLLVADVSEGGTPSVFSGTKNGRLLRYTVDGQAVAAPPPQWVEALPEGASSSRLVWRAPGADSVEVYAGPAGAELNPIASVTDSSVIIGGADARRYALRAWENGDASPLSSPQLIRPHPPATVSDLTYPDPSTVQLRFTEPLAPDIRADQFRFGPERMSPRRLVRARNAKAVVLHYSDEVQGQTGRLEWTSVEDNTGLPVGQVRTRVSFPSPARQSLFIEEATVLDENHLRLAFNAPLDLTAAQERDRYEVRPARGRVSSVQLSDESPGVVTLRIEGLVLGASGRESSLTVTDMVGADGRRLAEEGSTVRLTRPADDLSNVYVYPNPHRADKHEDELTIAGLPPQATVRIYTPGGRLVRMLSVENNRDGGRRWNLRNRRGERVPSGVYLFRVNAPNQSPVLEKAAIVQ